MRVAKAFYGLVLTKCQKTTVLLRVGLCEFCYRFLGFVSAKCRTNTVLLRVGLQCSFDLTFFKSHFGLKQYLTKKLNVTAFPQNDQEFFGFYGFPG